MNYNYGNGAGLIKALQSLRQCREYKDSEGRSRNQKDLRKEVLTRGSYLHSYYNLVSFGAHPEQFCFVIFEEFSRPESFGTSMRRLFKCLGILDERSSSSE